MYHSRITLAALAVATIALSAPAEARGHRSAQFGPGPGFVDAAAIPAYPTDRQTRTHHARSRAAVRRRPVVLASLPPSDVGQLAPSLPGTINAYRDRPAEHPTGPGLITVQTAAGIAITCSTAFAKDAAALIADAVAQGIKFSRITCYSRARTHVANSNHHSGNAMDTHPSIPASLVRAHSLRSGCDFRDCPHVDNARNVGGVAYWNSVKHRGPTVTASAERRHYRHRHRYRVRFAYR
jgi:hypothetical protein